MPYAASKMSKSQAIKKSKKLGALKNVEEDGGSSSSLGSV
jgi:hypothetical protein